MPIRSLNTGKNPVSNKNRSKIIFFLIFQNISIVESTPIQTTFPLLTAKDPDRKENGTIKEYRLINENNLKKFELIQKETLNGIILFLKLLQSLDREMISFYEIELNAKDSGTPFK